MKKTFLVQVDEKGIPAFDFCHTLLKSREFLEWHNDDSFNFITVTDCSEPLLDADSYIPVGSIDFMRKFVEVNYGKNAVSELKPIYPLCWNGKYMGSFSPHPTDVYFLATLQSNAAITYHVKHSKILKHPFNGDYTVSEIIANKEVFENKEWLSGWSVVPVTEWRVFVFNHEIIDMEHYAGDMWTLPNRSVVERFIKDYKTIGYDPAVAYTLDVGVDGYSGATQIVEFHEFYSCGLYGFADYKNLPYMFSQQWFKILQRIKKAK